MTTFKLVVGDPESRRAYKLEVEQAASGLLGKRIGEEVLGESLGLPGYVLRITGGTDKDGFPMHPGVRGPGRKRVLLSGPPCFHPRLKGQRKRKTVRGDTIGPDIVQVNLKVIKKGLKPIEELLSKNGEQTRS